MNTRRLRLGSRGSRLALIQSELIAAGLRRLGHEVDIVRIVTEGDNRTDTTAIGDGIFVGALESALVAGDIDLAMHSAKDMALEERGQLVVGAYTERADPRDALVTRDGRGLGDLPQGAVVGTDSPRRQAFLLALRPDLEVRSVRGNVDTRVRRLDEGVVDALVLAAAGLDRLGLADRIALRFDPAQMPPAPAQGALAAQVRRDDKAVRALMARLDLPRVRLAVTTERGLLAHLGGGCRAPIGALAEVRDERLHLTAAAMGRGGVRHITIDDEATPEGSRRLIRSAGSELRTALPATL
ncbi:MAG TPA: hydroxymethylbilane synthase [Candidatus Dormibacteraeota bacterium]|nr:hydroxymethylbilane synthase [Candidatus Dormibacteraeota bacterium]